MLNRTARIQLVIFAIVTVLTVGAISIFYLRVPARLGIGAYNITANFVAGGGLYENANVTYRGVQAGRVEAVNLTADGVAAHMRLNSDVKIPANSTATVKSVSAIGEQYVDLVPPDDPSQALLGDGSTIPKERTAIPQDVAELLREADQLVSGLNNTRLAGPAARDVQGVQRLWAGTCAADRIVAVADRRSQRELAADLGADRPGWAVPRGTDSQR